MKIYIASKAPQRPRWRALRASGVPIISRWIDVEDKYIGTTVGDPECLDYVSLWDLCVEDVMACDVLVCYVAPGEVLKGAILEIGIAIGLNKPVLLVGDTADYLRNGTWINYRGCDHREGWTIEEVLGDFRTDGVRAWQPCDVCAKLVAVNAVSPSECFCSGTCVDKHYEQEG